MRPTIYPVALQELVFAEVRFSVFVPVASEVKFLFEAMRKHDAEVPFPFWAKIWPAALVLASFIEQHPGYVQDKHVLELAGGLGVPSMMAARYAATVVCSDYLAEIVAVQRQSVEYNGLLHVGCEVLNWHSLPEGLSAQVLLVSDINYDPLAFDQVFAVLTRFIRQGCIVLLSTPQRLMAKPLIDRLLPWCVEQEVVQVNVETVISVLVLQA